MPRHFKVHELLDRSELDQLEEFAREPGRTVDECHEWLLARGYQISRTAVGTWKGAFQVQDQFRAGNEVARTLLEAAKEQGVANVADAASLQIGQMLFEAMVKGQETGQVDTKDLVNLSAGLKNVITGSRHLEKLKAEVRERQQLAVAEAEKVAKAGGSNEAVVSKVREILGIA
jgi:hypothetical protein